MTDEQFLAFLNSPIPHCNANSVQFIDQKRAWMAAIESTKQSAERENERLRELLVRVEAELTTLREQLAARTLLASDPCCPQCGHNRDKSSVSSIDNEDGTKSCQMCGTMWREIP